MHNLPFAPQAGAAALLPPDMSPPATPSASMYTYIQSRFYRSPEVGGWDWMGSRWGWECPDSSLWHPTVTDLSLPASVCAGHPGPAVRSAHRHVVPGLHPSRAAHGPAHLPW